MKLFVYATVFAAGLAAEAVSFNMLSCCPGEDTSTQARFVWHSDSNACTLWYAKASAPGSAQQATCESVCKPLSFRSSDVNYYKYTAALSSLDPGTEYIYYVKSGSTQSATQKFKTAGTSGSYNFLWLSDVHSHPDDSAKTNSVNTIIANAKSAAGSIDFILFSGDMVKYGARYDNWQQWNGNVSFTDYMHALCPGNKEYYNTGGTTAGANGSSSRIHNKWFLACRNNPQNGADGIESSYWFIRDSVMFVAMDTLADEGVDMDAYVYDNAFALQTNWFDRVVSAQKSAKSFRYLVVFQHYPHFTYAEGDGFQYGSGRYKKWKDLFDKHKVDFALTGDHHNYSRSKKLRGGSENSEGTVYITAPEIGKSLYSPSVKTASNLNSYNVTSGDNPTVKTLMATAHNGDEAVGGVWFSVTPEKMTMHYIGTSTSPYDTVEVAPKDRGFEYTPPVAVEGFDGNPHSRYRFAVDAPRNDSWCMQLSEIELFDASGNVIPSSAFTIAYDSTTKDSAGDTYPSNESPDNAVDGDLGTKWLDWRAGLAQSASVRSVVWLDFCFASPTAVSGYRWYTANDDSTNPGRTPVSWTFTASDDGGATWSVLDKVVDYDTTTENNALAYTKRTVVSESPMTAGGTYYALAVGVDLYSNPGNNLSCCNPDVNNVLSACTNSAKGLWLPANCYRICDSNATLSAVRQQFQSLAAKAQSGDTVLYYQSSHGGSNVLCLHNANYSESNFASDLMQFNSGVRVIVLLDACHSASMFKSADSASSAQGPWNFAANVEARMAEMREELRAKGAKAINLPSVGWMTACDVDQLSWGGSSGSTFTKAIANAWKSTSSTDSNGDGYNDFLEIFNVALPKATGDHGDDGWTIPQKTNDVVLASVAAWEIYQHIPDLYVWTGLGGDGKFSNGANWQGGEVPVAGVSLDFTSVTSATTIEADVNATFGAVTMGAGVVTFTGSLDATSFSDTSKIAVGANATVTLDGDLTYTATTGGGWMLNRLDGTFVVNGDIVVSGSADMKLAQTIGANGVVVVKGLVSNGGTSWTFRLNRSNSGDTARWVIGEDGLSGNSGFWMLAASSSSSAIIQPNTNDFVIADWIGAREGPTLTVDTTGWGDGVGHVVTATSGFIREGDVNVAGSGSLVCNYDASAGAYGQTAHSVAFNVTNTATLALDAGSNIGTGAVTVNGGAALELRGAGTATIGGTLTLKDGSRLVVGTSGAAVNVSSNALPESGSVNVSLVSELGVNATMTILSISGNQTLATSDLAKFSMPDGYVLSLGSGGKSVVATRYSGTWTGGMALSVPVGGVSIGSAEFNVSDASRANPITVTIGDGGTLASGSDNMVLSAATLPDENPAEYMVLANGVPPGHAAVFHANGTAIYVNVVPVKWVEESAERQQLTGRWSKQVIYGEDGRAYVDGDNMFIPLTASTGNVVTVETKVQFFEYSEDYMLGEDVQMAFRLSTNGCFQVWTLENVANSGNGDTGDIPMWIDVEAEGVMPVSGEEYSLRTTLNYSTRTYGVEVKTELTEFTRLREKGNSVKTNFPLAFSTNCVSGIGFVGDTYFTSLYGDCRCEIIGFVADEALILSNNVERILSAAEAAWLNKCAGGDKAAVQGAAAGLSTKEFTDAYLLNVDVAGDRSYTFEVTDIDVGDTIVTVSVTLTRSGKIDQQIKGVLKFYGAATLAAFKAGTAAPLDSTTFVDDDFSGSDTVTATFQKNANTFFNAAIEEK